MRKDEYNLDTKPLLKVVLSKFFGNSTGFVSMISEHVLSPVANAQTKVRIIFAVSYFAIHAHICRVDRANLHWSVEYTSCEGDDEV